jgi:hypothetical protein
MYVNIIESYRNIVTICDKELIGKRFEEGKKQLHVKESFYKGEKGKILNEEETKNIIQYWLKEDATFNIVGEKAVKLALNEKIIDEEGIGKIENIPYAMILL